MNSNIPNTKNNYIILTKNIIDSSNVGNLLYIKEKIMDLSINNRTDISWQTILTTQNNNFNNYKNRIILSGKINSIATNGTIASSTSCCLITQNNIKNNMKFIFDSSNNPNGKILFVKNLSTGDNLYNYLFNNLNNTLFENDSFYNIHNSLSTSLNASYNRYIYHLNYYLSKYDIYKINIRDYVYKYTKEISNNDLLTEDRKDICYNSISYSIKDICNNFNFINTTIDSSSIINFNPNNFSRLLIDNNNSFTSFNTDLYILEKNIDYSIYRNIWCYNKLTLDYRHDNYYDFSLSYSFNNNTIINSIKTNVIRTFLIKTNNFQILQNMKKHSKIIFGLKNIYLNNVKVLDKNSNLYTQNITYNNSTTTLNKDFSNLILLGLGNQVTGITQHDIYRHSHFSSNTSLITFKKNINTDIINSKFPSLIPNLNNKYLLDIPLNYTNNNVNNSYNINNTIKLNSILYNTSLVSKSRFVDINLYKYFDASSNNYFTNSFNNLAFLNNITNNIYSISYEQVNLAIYVQLKNIIKASNIKLKNKEFLETNLLALKSNDSYDLRYNYNQYFYISNNLDILLKLTSLRLTNNFAIESYQSDYNLLNFYSLTIGHLVKTSGSSDFTNVDCIYIYHDPINDPDPQFRYPNNNIEIKRDGEIDTLSKAIEQYRGSGARTSTTNAAFVPSQNGSNLSRKMIQGIIGLNNIPKLLSIEPYDPNFINGRGFINQFQIEDTCITSNCDKIAVKQNAIKHDSVKNNRIYSSNSLKKQNFANIVKSNVRNKLSQDCITKIQSTNRPIINIPCTNNTVIKQTPFVLFNKGKGNYLR